MIQHQIIDETETHVKIAGKGLAGDKNEWSFVWVPKDAILPPLEQEAGEGGIRTAKLKKGTEIVVEDPAGKKKPVSVKAEDFHVSRTGKLFYGEKKPETRKGTSEKVRDGVIDFVPSVGKKGAGKGRRL